MQHVRQCLPQWTQAGYLVFPLMSGKMVSSIGAKAGQVLITHLKSESRLWMPAMPSTYWFGSGKEVWLPQSGFLYDRATGTEEFSEKVGLFFQRGRGNWQDTSLSIWKETDLASSCVDTWFVQVQWNSHLLASQGSNSSLKQWLSTGGIFVLVTPRQSVVSAEFGLSARGWALLVSSG